MADIVQYMLEHMVNELKDLEVKGIFTHQELAGIVKNRRKFEYRVKSPSPLKQDYLEYIEFEKSFDKLRYLRKKSISRELVNLGENKLKRSVSDQTSKGRIIDIYRLVTRRFRGDLALWFQYINFCKEHDHKDAKGIEILYE